MKTLRLLGLFVVIVLASGLTTSCGSSTAKTAADVAAKAGLGDVLASSFGSIGQVLGGIFNASSAQSALPKLQELDAEVGDIQKQAANLSASEKKSLTDIVAAQLPPLKTALDKVYAVPGTREVIQPTMDSILSKFAKF